MDNSVIYLISGRDHLPYLVVSLFNLRRKAGFTGDVSVYAWPESYSVVERIAEDDTLQIEAHRREPLYRGKNSQFLDKTRLMIDLAKAGDGGFLYLDADTMPVRNIDFLFNRLKDYNFVCTQFNQWTCGGKIIQNRLNSLLKAGLMPAKYIQDCMNAADFPSLNGGIWGVRGVSPVLESWASWTDKHKKILFIADEVCLHPVVYHWMDTEGECCIAEGGVWNASPKFYKGDDRRVCIWHFHGDSNVRPDKSKRGYSLWWPMYRFLLNENIGGMADWRESISNKHLCKRERECGLREEVLK